MWFNRGPIKESTESHIYYFFPTQIGNSGGPLFKTKQGNEFVVGIHIGNTKKGNASIRLTNEIRLKFNDWAEKTGELDLSKKGITQAI